VQIVYSLDEPQLPPHPPPPPGAAPPGANKREAVKNPAPGRSNGASLDQSNRARPTMSLRVTESLRAYVCVLQHSPVNHAPFGHQIASVRRPFDTASRSSTCTICGM
jgi:hypothetical protein